MCVFCEHYNQDNSVLLSKSYLFISSERLLSTTHVVTQQAGTDQTKPNHTKADQEKQHTACQLPPANSDHYAQVCWSNQSFHLGEDGGFPGRATSQAKKELSAPGCMVILHSEITHECTERLNKTFRHECEIRVCFRINFA